MLAAFRFDEARHLYTLGDQPIPSVTQLIEKGGLVNGSAYFTEESRRRGSAVHDMAANHDLGVDIGDQLKVSPYAGYALAYIAAARALAAEWVDVEVAEVHPEYRFGGRPDRVGRCLGRPTVGEIKSAAKAKHHAVQTALQAILVAPRLRLAPELLQRLCIYVKPSGKFAVELHEDPRDFLTAKDLIRRFAC